ncbi:MAG: stage V sporulation protein AE [Beduini sp.]|uniref:stage V sporulation protein AE n=1 Tax=Beduini sp. TaxID=1922300 RepID=UPI0011CBCD7E
MDYILAFVFCGAICVIAQLIYELTSWTPGHITSLFVCIGSFLDLFHIYDRLIGIFHAGAMLPITSFGHSLMHGALEKVSEYGLLGLTMGMFDLTAAGITTAILFGFIVAIIFKPRS